MSWKIVRDRMKHNKIAESLSITKRLTILYAISAFILLAISAVTLDWILVSDMEFEDNQFLASEIQSIHLLLREHPREIETWKKVIERETIASASVYLKYYVRILDERGISLVETPGMSEELIRFSFPAVEYLEQSGTKGIKLEATNGRPFLFMASRIEPGSAATEARYIQIALDMSHEDAIIHGYRRKMIIILIAGVFFSALIGFLVAREGLRPLKDIARSVQTIGPDRLHERVASTRWPREVMTLARSFDVMLERLETSFTGLSRFSADLAHELRTPINNLRGEAEVALYKAREASEYRQVIESSLEEYGRLSRMIENLLFLARAESRDTTLRYSTIDAHKEIEALLEFYDALSQEKLINVICNGNAVLNADPVLFRQAVNNVLSNAFQYTPENGAIEIEIARQDNGSVGISISDTGIGIEPENISRIFDRFFRTERARDFYPEGTGLGFSIVKSIMDLHGGSVSIQSEPREGTTVILVFNAT
ncbi:MAG: sensor histidine kinase [Deltaproteobacteria bacterium]|nr:sensor histidine kinase [Deltaproteobacteria bacterium]